MLPKPEVVAAHLAASFRLAAQSEAAALAKLAVKPAQANSELLFRRQNRKCVFEFYFRYFKYS